MKHIRASAPTKAIIAGEHSVVYGGVGIAVPINNRKYCECTVADAERGGVNVEDVMGIGKYNYDGKYIDSDGWFGAKAKLIEHVLKTEKKGIEHLKIEMNFSRNRIPKGTGHSAATAAAMALCLFNALNVKHSKEKLFEAVQVFETAAHGGRPSGIDAQAVLSDKPQVFRKEFLGGGRIKFDFEGAELALPKGHTLLIVSTLREGETAETTQELIAKFAEANGIEKNPSELSETEREKITAPFNELLDGIRKEMHLQGNAEKLGGLFQKNQLLLQEAGVSSEGVEKAVSLAGKNGALGAKITGAGGRGGAIIVLCNEKRANRILDAFAEEGMQGGNAEFAKRGAMLEE